MEKFICKVVPVRGRDGSGDLQDVPNLPYPVPVPAVLDLDYRTGYTLRVRFDLDGSGAFGLRSLAVSADDGTPDVTGKVLRSIRVGELVSHVQRYLRSARLDYQHLGGLAGATLREQREFSSPQEFMAWAESQREPEPKYSDKRLPPSVVLTSEGMHISAKELAKLRELGPSHPYTASMVATLYRGAEEHGVPPVQIVQERLGIPKRTASHWVKVAREVGALEPSRRKPREVAPDGDD